MLGEERGDELPEQLRTPEGRREFFRRPGSSLLGRTRARGWAEEPKSRRRPDPEFEFDPERILARVQGRKGWLRDAERQLEQHRWEHPDPVCALALGAAVVGGRAAGGRSGCRARGNEAFEHHRVHGRDAQGRRLAGTPNPYEPPEVPAGKVNVTDPTPS